MRVYVLNLLVCLCVMSCGWNANTPDLDPQTFKAEIIKAGSQVVDVRTPKEYAQGHIKGAVNIDYFSEDFETQFKQLDTSKKLYIYCRSGKRSSKSASRLEAMGFEDVYELEGGIINWRSVGFKTMD